MNRDQIAEVIFNHVFPDLFGRLPWSAVKNEDARAPILAAADAIMALDGWQTIDSAPRDGTVVDVWEDGKRHANVFWNAPQDSWASRSWRRSRGGRVHLVTVCHLNLTPTHWRPLPQPPGDAG